MDLAEQFEWNFRLPQSPRTVNHVAQIWTLRVGFAAETAQLKAVH